MISVILAAGRGTRLDPITITLPKPLIPLGEFTLIDYSIGAVYDKFESIIIVVQYLSEQIIHHFDSSPILPKIKFVLQDTNKSGTMGALLSAKEFIDKNFLVMCSDNLYDPRDVERLIQHPNSILIKTVEESLYNYKYKGCKSIIPRIPTDNYIDLDAGMGYFDKNFLELIPVKVKPESNEIGIPHTLYLDFQKNPMKYSVVRTEHWEPIGTRDQLKEAEVNFPNFTWLKAFNRN